MNVTLRNIPSTSGGDPATAPSGGRRMQAGGENTTAAGERRKTPEIPAKLEPRSTTRSQLRNRILTLQREVTRAQRVLGGLEGLGSVLTEVQTAGTPAAGTPIEPKLEEYLARVTYRGEPVLAPLRERLAQILRSGDGAALQGLVDDSRQRLGFLAQELSRYETERQNTRAIAVSGDPLRALKREIQKEGSRLLDLQPENVLRLLG
jgi:ribosomal protein S30